MATIKLNIRPACQIEIEAQDPKQACKALAAFAEILTDSECGKCKSKAIKHEWRRHDDNDFFGMRCTACNATLSFGQHKSGNTLFCKRDRGENGWHHYQRDQQAQSQAGAFSPMADESEIAF